MLCLTCGANGLLLAPVQAKVEMQRASLFEAQDPGSWPLCHRTKSNACSPSFQQISFALGDVVYEFSGHLDYVHFPTTAIVSLLYTMENGATAEMGLTGNDGVVGPWSKAQATLFA